MLFGCKELHVYTDHKNLTFQNLQTQRVLRWRLYLEEYNPHFHYIKGSENTMADALSRLPIRDIPSKQPCAPQPDSISESLQSHFSMAIDEDNLLDCFLNLPAQHGLPFQLDYKTISTNQSQDQEILNHAQRAPNQVVRQLLNHNTYVYCYIPSPGAPWKIYLLRALLRNVV